MTATRAWRRRYLDVGGVRLYVTITGRGVGPPVVLAHGVTDDGTCWTEVATNLAVDHDVVMVDARGHGRSDAPAHGYGARAHAADLLGVIRLLELDRPILIGHSMGATSVLTLAATEPTVPRAVVLEDPSPWRIGLGAPVPADQQRRDLVQYATMLLALKRRTHDELVLVQREAAPRWSDEEVRRWAESTQRLSPTVITTLDEQVDTNRDLDWTVLLPRIACPVLLLTADPARGALVRPHVAELLVRSVPDARAVHIAEAGHSIRHDQLDAYLTALRGFLADA